MDFILCSLIALCAALTIAGKYRSRTLLYIFKPLTTLLIVLLALDESRVGKQEIYQWLIGAGLLFSLLGDVFLMLRRERFLAGLISFLLAHLLYITAFLQDMSPADGPLWLWGAFLLYAAGGLYLLLPRVGALKLPVAAYTLALNVMAVLACSRLLVLETQAATYAAIGAVLFLLSDSILSWNKFVKPFAVAELLLLSTYFAGQTLIALSV
ncbi:MAG: lysoplasmalogenase [Nevskiales bacterium]